MSKRLKFITTSLILSLGFVAVQFLPEQYKLLTITLLGVLTVILFSWSLWEGLGVDMTLTSLILPFFFTVSVGFFWFLLPGNLFARIPIVVFYGGGIYALCLTVNIYTVAAIRTIALLRAARGVGFVLTLLTSFLTFDAFLSLKLAFPLNGLLVFVSSLALFFQGFWSIPLDKNFSTQVLTASLISSLIMAEVASVLGFWPVTVVVGSLFLTVSLYVLLGLGQARLEARLFAQTTKEYLLIGLIVSLGMFLATRWRG